MCKVVKSLARCCPVRYFRRGNPPCSILFLHFFSFSRMAFLLLCALDAAADQYTGCFVSFWVQFCWHSNVEYRVCVIVNKKNVTYVGCSISRRIVCYNLVLVRMLVSCCFLFLSLSWFSRNVVVRLTQNLSGLFVFTSPCSSWFLDAFYLVCDVFKY